MPKFLAEFTVATARKPQFYLFFGFLKIKNSLASFSLIFENSTPKGFSWRNMKKSVFSVLKINSRYLQSPGLKKETCVTSLRKAIYSHFSTRYNDVDHFSLSET